MLVALETLMRCALQREPAQPELILPPIDRRSGSVACGVLPILLGFGEVLFSSVIELVHEVPVCLLYLVLGRLESVYSSFGRIVYHLFA